MIESAPENWDIRNLINGPKIELSIKRLDSVLEQLGVDRIDFMKIDVQGSKWMGLEGVINAIKSKLIRMIQMEFIYIETYSDTKDLSTYISFFEQNGYKLASIFDLNWNSTSELLQFELLFQLK